MLEDMVDQKTPMNQRSYEQRKCFLLLLGFPKYQNND